MKIHPYTPQARAFEGATKRAAQRIHGEGVTLGWREAVPVVTIAITLLGALLAAWMS
jgi:hypothetical protein